MHDPERESERDLERDPEREPDLLEEMEPLEPGQFFQLAWTFYLLLAVGGIVWLAIARDQLELKIFFDPASWPTDLGLGVVVALAIVGAWHGLRRFIAGMRDLEMAMINMIGTIDASESFALALISGFSEELFFRGAVQGSAGWLWATLLFGFIHTGPGTPFRIWTVFALTAGGAFSWLTIYTGNLAAAIVAHVLINWIQFHLLLNRPEEAQPS